MEAVFEDWKTAPVSEPVRGALRLVEAITKHPQDIDAAFLAVVRGYGLNDEAIREAANVAFQFNLINRVADALDFAIPTAKQKKRLVSGLNTAGRFVKGAQADPVQVTGVDGVIRPTEVEAARTRILTTEGETTSELRRSAEAYVMAAWGVSRAGVAAIPSDLERYLKKLSLYAYRITDEETDALRAAGYSKDAIYELTMVGAFAAALVGIEAVFQAMYGG